MCAAYVISRLHELCVMHTHTDRSFSSTHFPLRLTSSRYNGEFSRLRFLQSYIHTLSRSLKTSRNSTWLEKWGSEEERERAREKENKKNSNKWLALNFLPFLKQNTIARWIVFSFYFDLLQRKMRTRAQNWHWPGLNWDRWKIRMYVN